MVLWVDEVPGARYVPPTLSAWKPAISGGRPGPHSEVTKSDKSAEGTREREGEGQGGVGTLGQGWETEGLGPSALVKRVTDSQRTKALRGTHLNVGRTGPKR